MVRCRFIGQTSFASIGRGHLAQMRVATTAQTPRSPTHRM